MFGKLIPILIASGTLCAAEPETPATIPSVQTWYQETLYPHWGQTFAIDKMIHQEKSEFWDLAIFENSFYGRVLAIDGNIQTTEKDEPMYHEMMVHVPLLAHGNAASVLVIGGGDGGIIREVLRHNTVQKVTMVEIDRSVIDLSKKYLPSLSNGAFDDPRLNLVIQDAAKFVKETGEKFDVIISDAPDPEGAAVVLFSGDFYADCHKLLNPNGIFVNQNGVPLLQTDELKTSLQNRSPHFKHVSFYVTPVPTYVGGYMTLGWASDKAYRVSAKTLTERMKNVKGKMKYYTPAVHKASFALPQYILDMME